MGDGRWEMGVLAAASPWCTLVFGVQVRLYVWYMCTPVHVHTYSIYKFMYVSTPRGTHAQVPVTVTWWYNK